MSSVRARSDMPEEYTWDLASLFEDDQAWESAYGAVADRLDELRAYEGQVTDDPDTLLSVLELREDVMRELANVAAYARMRRDEDTRDGTYQALAARAQSLAADASSAASFIEPELQELERVDLEAFVDREPALERYDHYFDDVLRTKPHTRSPEIEALLAEIGEVTGAAGEIYTMLANADMTFETVEGPEGEGIEITMSNFTKLQKHPNRAFRRRVYECFYDEWASVRNAVGTAYRNSVKADVKHAWARNYDTAREAALDGPNVPVEVYDTLVETVRENLGPLGRHAELKREHLGLDELRMWDLYTPLVEANEPEISYEEATQHVIEAVAPLGEDYQRRLESGLGSRWVDVYENPGKQSGAYSGGTYDSQPYVLMNYQDDVASMYTLAHELGHSLHTQFASETQPYVYSDYEIFVAEVASTLNETLLTEHLLESTEDEVLHRHVLDEYVERIRSTLFRQTMFAEFEQRAHEIAEDDGALTPDRLDELYGDLKSTYYEPAAIDDRIASEWMRIPHFYRAFYVYQYATGISAAIAIAREVLEAGQPATERYRTFLESGSHGYPLELLGEANVDMRSSDPIEAAIEEYDERLSAIARLD